MSPVRFSLIEVLVLNLLTPFDLYDIFNLRPQACRVYEWLRIRKLFLGGEASSFEPYFRKYAPGNWRERLYLIHLAKVEKTAKLVMAIRRHGKLPGRHLHISEKTPCGRIRLSVARFHVFRKGIVA